jgi:hypothetical protein
VSSPLSSPGARHQQSSSDSSDVVKQQRALVESGAITVLTHLCQHVCALASTWLEQMRIVEESRTQQDGAESTAAIPELPDALQAPVARICHWIRDMLKPALSSKAHMRELAEAAPHDASSAPSASPSRAAVVVASEEEDEDIAAAIRAERNPFLMLVASAVAAVDKLMHVPSQTQSLLSADSSGIIISSAETRTPSSTARSDLANRFLRDSDPRNVLLSGAPTTAHHRKLPAPPAKVATVESSEQRRPHHSAHPRVEEGRSEGHAPHASVVSHVFDRLLSQALADADSLALQKEHLLLDRRQLAAKVDTLTAANRQLSAELRQRAADHEDTLATLHKQIEILSEALTDQQAKN